MPVLAVCRGSQLLNVARGGDLVQHLPDELGHERHKHEPGQFSDHDVRLDPGSRVGALLGEHAPVKSHHHQGYGRLGEGLREAAWADDGTVEALEDPEQALRGRRPLASRGGRGLRALPGARRGGRAATARSA